MLADLAPLPPGTVSCVLHALVQFARVRTPGLDVNDVLERSGIAPATFWRLMTNRNDRVSVDVIARCCATLQVPSSSVLWYWTPTTTQLQHAFPHVVATSIISYGRVMVVLPRVLHGYADIWGAPLDQLHTMIGTRRKTIDLLLDGDPTLLDLNIIARIIDTLTSIARHPSPAAQLFAAWLQDNGYTPGTTELVLRYVPENHTDRSVV